MNSHLLITGAAGYVATILRRHWGDRYRLRLADIRSVTDPAAHETFVSLDITDLDAMVEACRDIDTVIHLAADRSPEGTFRETLHALNVVGTYHAFHAAAEAGCRRIVFASSVHAVLGHDPPHNITESAPVRPRNVYGATKCWGEALASSYNLERGLSCICVRLGSPIFRQDGDWDADAPSCGISGRDTAQLFGRCVDVQDVPFAIVHGASRHRRSEMAIEETCRLLGYQPQDGTAFAKAAG